MATATSAQGTEYHYILTLQHPDGRGGYEVVTARGTVHATPGGTRAEALDYVLGLVDPQRDWRPEKGSILFFALEPNQLGGAR